MSAFGEIKEGTDLEDYDTKYSWWRPRLLRAGVGTFGTVLIGGLGYAAYLKYTKPKPKSLAQKIKQKIKR